MTQSNSQVISFTKMHGLGNDFVIINAIQQPFHLANSAIQQLADRHRGIGFDQLLIIEPSTRADFFCRIFNSDGSEAEQCGNGLRCIARLVHEEGLCPHSSFKLETKAGLFAIHIEDYDHIAVTMGAPQIQKHLVELSITHHANIPVSVLSVGNPHAILKVDCVDMIEAQQLGTAISNHAFFPHGANVGFMQIINPHHIRLRTFERGAGETHACGSNACAAVVAGIANGWLKDKVNVEFRYGKLAVEWAGNDQPICMIGPAARVFAGEINSKP